VRLLTNKQTDGQTPGKTY